MKDHDKTKEQLIEELNDLRRLFSEMQASNEAGFGDRALREQNERFKSLFNGLNEPVFLHYHKAEGFHRFMEV